MNGSRPIVTTLCGSTRFPTAFALANMHLSLQGRVVIGLGMMGHSDDPPGARFLTADGDESTPEKQGLDTLHFRKIDLSDGIYVCNVGGLCRVVHPPRDRVRPGAREDGGVHVLSRPDGGRRAGVSIPKVCFVSRWVERKAG